MSKPLPWDQATRKAHVNDPPICNLVPNPNLGINLNRAAADKYKKIYGVTKKSSVEYEMLKRDMCVQWGNASNVANDFANWYGFADQTPVVLVDMSNATFGLKRELHDVPLKDKHNTAANLVAQSFQQLATLYNGINGPLINFILVGTSRDDHFERIQPMINMVQLYIPCIDVVYKSTCRLVHGFAEIDDMFIIIIASWLMSRGIDVSLFSHDRYEWWKNPLDIPRVYFGLNGELYKGDYVPTAIFYGFKGFAGYMDTND